MKADGCLEEVSTPYFSDLFTITYDDIGEGASAEDEGPAEEAGCEEAAAAELPS